ncbi:MAG: hypothetical protein R3B70_28800 [Polyangiaceae bacterium]
MAGHLARSFRGVERIQTEVASRGVDAVLENLRTGLSLAASDGAYRALRHLSPLSVSLTEKPTSSVAGTPQKPAFFLQQLACRCRTMNVLKPLAAAAEAKLSAAERARFELLWRTSTESQSLVRR